MAGTRRRHRRTGRAGWRRLSQPGVWLATLSTVVGLATGMFTLRDQVLPGESGSAQAARADYQASVGAICQAVNEGDKARARDARALRRRLPRARSIAAQRDLLLDSTNRRIAALVDEISRFGGLRPPSDESREHSATSRAWRRNLDRIRDYAHALDGAGTRAQLAAALDLLYRHRVPLSRDGLTVRTGLSQLGGRHCHLDKPIVTPNVTLPRSPSSGQHAHSTGSANPPGGSGGGSANPPSGSSGTAVPPAGSGGGSALLPEADTGTTSSPSYGGRSATPLARVAPPPSSGGISGLR
jgi:hypothetical protein